MRPLIILSSSRFSSITFTLIMTRTLSSRLNRPKSSELSPWEKTKRSWSAKCLSPRFTFAASSSSSYKKSRNAQKQDYSKGYIRKMWIASIAATQLLSKARSTICFSSRNRTFSSVRDTGNIDGPLIAISSSKLPKNIVTVTKLSFTRIGKRVIIILLAFLFSPPIDWS